MTEPVFKAPPKYPVQEWKVPSSTTDEIYTVGLWFDYKLSCTCIRFRMKRDTCKHIQAKRLELESLYGSIYNYCQKLKEDKKQQKNV